MFTVRKNYIWMGIKLFVSSIIQCVAGFNVLVDIFGDKDFKSSMCTDILFSDCSINADKDRSTVDLSSITLFILTKINWMDVKSFDQN